MRSGFPMPARLSALVVCAAVLALTACEKKGPGERAGEHVDHAADTIRNGGEEPTRDKLQDQADKARDKVDDATQKDH